MRGLTFEKYSGTAGCTFCGSGNTRTAMKFASSKLGKSTIYPICMKCLEDINVHVYKQAAERVMKYAEKFDTLAEKRTVEKVASFIRPKEDDE